MLSCSTLLILFNLELKIFFGWNRLMCLFHTGIYAAWYLYLSKWLKYLGILFIVNLGLCFLQEKVHNKHHRERNNVSNQTKPWCLHQALGLAKGSMMLHWTGHTAGNLTCQVKGHFEHQMLKLEFVLYLWHCDHCLFWTHKDKRKEKYKKTKIMPYTLNYLYTKTDKTECNA